MPEIIDFNKYNKIVQIMDGINSMYRMTPLYDITEAGKLPLMSKERTDKEKKIALGLSMAGTTSPISRRPNDAIIANLKGNIERATPLFEEAVNRGDKVLADKYNKVITLAQRYIQEYMK